MPETIVGTREALESMEVGGRRKKARFPSASKMWSSASTPHQRTLELEGVIEVLREYDSVEGNDINCSICGKRSSFFVRPAIAMFLYSGFSRFISCVRRG